MSKLLKVDVIVITFADTAYLDNRSYGVHQMSVWVPFMNAIKETGCMEVSFLFEN